jgi:putative addiction module component (TIGR02574 family)
MIRWSGIARHAEDAMSEAAEKLKPLLAALTAHERAELAEYLLSLNGGDEEEWDEEFVEEINRRAAEMESGKVQGIPHEEVMRKLKEKYG